MEMILIFCVFLFFGTCIFLAWYFTHMAKHKERLMMIEKGIDPQDEAKKDWGVKSGLLKLGIVVIGLSVGLLIISVLVEFHCLGDSGATPLGILGICGGGSLIIANRVTLSKKP